MDEELKNQFRQLFGKTYSELELVTFLKKPVRDSKFDFKNYVKFFIYNTLLNSLGTILGGLLIFIFSKFNLNVIFNIQVIGNPFYMFEANLLSSLLIYYLVLYFADH